MSGRFRIAALIALLAAGGALGIALVSERYGGLVPCALCLWQRWPYRIAIALALAALLLPRRFSRWAMLALLPVMLAAAGLGLVHVGVEFGWWPTPLPQCAAATFTPGLSIAERLARMPAVPAKPCDAPVFLIPGLPLSMAAMNLLFALAFALALAIFLRRNWRDGDGVT